MISKIEIQLENFKNKINFEEKKVNKLLVT